MSVSRDVAGNPTDPEFLTAIFQGSQVLANRSVFTDKGPIARASLTIQSGINATINGPDTITLTGATLSSAQLGLQLTLTGTATNAGTFRITAVLSVTKVRVNASFTLPDASNGTITWRVFDPRNGEVSDDPDDVVVRINGTPVVPEAVIGLLGQIVLPSVPDPDDEVKVDYRWIPNPTVEIRRLNSREFRLNSWNRDGSTPGHAYRYNNVLITPSDYAPTDVQAPLAQPTQRDLKYRAYERAYTAALNDPNLLRLNSPIHRIAYPPLSRTIESTFVSYTATVLPESDAAAPWVRHGAGNASILGGNTLVVDDTSSGPYPSGQPIFWTRLIDLTFDHVFASTWRVQITSVPAPQGVFTGIVAGYSDADRAIIVGYLDDGGTKKIGLLKAGAGNDPSTIDGWTGGLDGDGNPTGAPVEFDWSVVHSYRLLRDRDGNVKIFIDGDVDETLRLTEAEMPYLEELDAPFDALEGAFFGSVSRPATNSSQWNFYRYSILPTNPLQTTPSIFVSYEGTTIPEAASQPWTPVGFAGTESIIGASSLLLDSTSATDNTSTLVGGDFKGFVRIEPLLALSSDVVLDVDVQLRTHTHGISPNAIMAAIDDGSRIIQLSFLADAAAPKLSYGGHSLPNAFTPVPWTPMGTQTAAMVGRYLRITDTSTTDGLLYYVNDNEPIAATTRTVSSLSDYMLETRAKVVSYTPDASGFCGVNADVYDGLRSVGLLLREASGVRYVSLHSDGVVISSFAFEWNDGGAHTYRLVKSTGGNLVSLFVDSNLLGTAAYSAFATPGAGAVGVVAFGSATAASSQARSVVEWTYTNVWRVISPKRFVGVWRGSDSNTLMGYHLPLKAAGPDAFVSGNTFNDPLANFITSGVSIGDYIIVDVGSNKGAYTVASVSATTLTINGVFPSTPSHVAYRIPAETDWTSAHRYRIVRDPDGTVAVFLDSTTAPLIRMGYNETELPPSAAGILKTLSGALPSIAFGAFDPTNLSQSSWDYVRFGITRSPTELRIAPHHQFLNQRNVIASPEHLFTSVSHSHTDFWSSSTGIPPQTYPDFLQDPSIVAYTLLNEDTPLVPRTQTLEVRNPQVVSVPVSALNRPEDVLNSDGDFTLNDGTTRVTLVIPDDVLYNSLQVIETTTGEINHIAPFNDEPPNLGTLYFQKEHCLSYNGNTLPQADVGAPTPWVLDSDNPTHVTASAFAGVLTYGTDGTGTRTIYRNATPLPDSVGMATHVVFRIKLLSDSSGGAGDSQVRFGFSAPGFTIALALVTSALGERYVLAIDQSNGAVLGGQRFDFLDGNFHSYKLVKDPGAGLIRIFIDAPEDIPPPAPTGILYEYFLGDTEGVSDSVLIALT